MLVGSIKSQLKTLKILLLKPGTEEYSAIKWSNFLNLCWDIDGDGFGRRQIAYECYPGGNSIRIAGCHYQAVDVTCTNKMIEELLNEMKSKIICANAIFINAGKILLTRESNSSAYYFPGGKVGPSENLEQALSRELKEELSLVIDDSQIRWAFKHQGPAYKQPDRVVELNCFFVRNTMIFKASSEIYDYKWCKPNEQNVAPVVRNALYENEWIFNT